MDPSTFRPNGSHELPLTPSGTTVETQLHSSSPPAKRRRTSANSLSNCCRTCRLRKVKCTGNPGNGPCTNCARLELACPFVTDAQPAQPSDKVERIKPSQSHTEAGTLRKRAQRACSQCHAQKTKCSGDLPHCKRCVANGLECEYTPAKRKLTKPRAEANQSPEDKAAVAVAAVTPTAEVTPANTASVSNKSEKSVSPRPDSGSSMNGTRTDKSFFLGIDTSSLTAQDLLNRRDFLLRHLDAYFENLYWLPCMGFFHPETAYRQVYEGNFDPPTAAALCALASFFVSSSETTQEYAMKCCDEVEFYIFRNIHKFSERVLLPYALNLCFNFLNGSFAKTWQCFGVAARLMTGLQLNWEVSTRNKSFSQQELLRRLAWQFFVMDRLLAGGYEEYILCRSENMKIRLPCHEDAFWENKPLLAERLSDKVAKCKGVGIHGLNVRMTDLNHRIQNWTKRLASRASLEPSKVMEDINNFQNELTRFHLSIPDDIRLSDQSISKYMASPERIGYVFLHTHLSLGHIDLYRFALPGILDPKVNDILRRLPEDFVLRSRKQAVAHALCTGRFCVAIQNEVDKHPATGKLNLAGDCTIPKMASESLRVFLIAMEHKIYDDLTEDTTAPLWHFQKPNDEYVRSLIENGLFRVSAPWGPVLLSCKKVHENNQEVYEEYNRTLKFAEQTNGNGFVQPNAPGGSSRLPGPHYILENANQRVAEQEARVRASDAATADRWFRGPAVDDHTSPYNPAEADFDSEYGPPGLPLLLTLINPVADSAEGQNPQDVFPMDENSAMMQGKGWGVNGAVDAPPPHGGQFMPAGGANNAGGGPNQVPVVPMNPTEAGIMFPPPAPGPVPNGQQAPPAQPPPPHFIPAQAGMYVGEYGHQQYAEAGAADSSAYMPQTSFG